jgi:Spy/CpxP family protein refolding chaperone
VKRVLFSAAVVAFTAVTLGGVAAAQMPEAPPGKWWKRPRIVEQLKLTPEQQERLETIFSKNRRAFVDLKADVERRQIDAEELVTKKDSDPKKASQAIDALEQAQFKLRRAMAMMVLEQKDVLTATQWQAIVERREEWRRERQEQRRMSGEVPRGRPGAGEAPMRPRPNGTTPPPEPREEKLEE